MNLIKLFNPITCILTITAAALISGCGGGNDVSANNPSTGEDPTPPTGIKATITVNSARQDVYNDGDSEMVTELSSQFYYQFNQGDDIQFELGEGNTVGFAVSTNDPEVNSDLGGALGPNDSGTVEAPKPYYSASVTESDEHLPAAQYRRAPVSREIDDDHGGITTYQTQLIISIDRTHTPPDPWFPTPDSLDPDLSNYLFNAPNSSIRAPKIDEITAPTASTLGDASTYYELTDIVTLGWEPAAEDHGEQIEIHSAALCGLQPVVQNPPIQTGGDTGTITIPIEDFLTTLRAASEDYATLPDTSNCELRIILARVANGNLDPVFSVDSIFIATTFSDAIRLITAIP